MPDLLKNVWTSAWLHPGGRKWVELIVWHEQSKYSGCIFVVIEKQLVKHLELPLPEFAKVSYCHLDCLQLYVFLYLRVVYPQLHRGDQEQLLLMRYCRSVPLTSRRQGLWSRFYQQKIHSSNETLPWIYKWCSGQGQLPAILARKEPRACRIWGCQRSLYIPLRCYSCLTCFSQIWKLASNGEIREWTAEDYLWLRKRTIVFAAFVGASSAFWYSLIAYTWLSKHQSGRQPRINMPPCLCHLA